MFRQFNEEFKKMVGMTMKESLDFIKAMGVEPFEVEEADEWSNGYILIGSEFNHLVIEFNENGKVEEIFEDLSE